MKHWNEYWQTTKFAPIYRNPPAEVYGGTNFEPLASIGMSCFTDAVRDKFVDGFSIVDYGCGAGILCNFISERLADFNYFGLEPNSGWGPARIDLGRQYFNDPRINFGLIESNYENIIKSTKVDAVMLISVLTHLTIEDGLNVLDNVQKVFDYNKDASIVLSCFTSDTSRIGTLQPNINTNYYSDSYIKLEDLEAYCKANNLSITKHMDFVAMGGWNHEIFKIEKIW